MSADQQTALFYRIGLIEGILLLLFVVLAFGALTIFGRQLLSASGIRESLLARLAAGAVLGSVAAGGAAALVINFVEAAALPAPNVSVEAARNQALLGLVLAAGLATAAIIRIEVYHRKATGAPVAEEESEWRLEEPGVRKG